MAAIRKPHTKTQRLTPPAISTATLVKQPAMQYRPAMHTTCRAPASKHRHSQHLPNKRQVRSILQSQHLPHVQMLAVRHAPDEHCRQPTDAQIRSTPYKTVAICPASAQQATSDRRQPRHACGTERISWLDLRNARWSHPCNLRGCRHRIHQHVGSSCWRGNSRLPLVA